MNKLWGGRFTKSTNKLVEEFTNSIHYDYKLAGYDCVGSLAHIEVLKKAKLLNSSEYSKLKKGLKKILATIRNGTFKFDAGFEDIHSYIQHLLEKDTNVGKAALKLHTCRSRNDQVVFDTKLYCLANILKTEKLLIELRKNLDGLSKKNKGLCLPGYTHLQHAIPVSLKDYVGAYTEMFSKDERRLLNTFCDTELTLGSGALAGTFINASHYNLKSHDEIPKSITAPLNTISSVSDRDFIIETLSTLSIIGMHLSRLAEDMTIWASSEFGFIDIDDAFCTGSSLMPQKKNPDVFELVRGYAGRLYGNLVSVLVLLKGLPLSYNRDLQLDKEPLFESFKIVHDELAILSEMFKHVRFKKDNIQKQLQDECLYATDIVDYLVQNGVAFKEAHKKVGELVQYKLKSSRKLTETDESVLNTIHTLLTSKVLKKIINADTSVQSKRSKRPAKITKQK